MYKIPGSLKPVPVAKWPNQRGARAETEYVLSKILYDGSSPVGFGNVPDQTDTGRFRVVQGFKRYLSTPDHTAMPSDVDINMIYQHWFEFLYKHVEGQVKNALKKSNKPQEIWNERPIVFSIPNSWAAGHQTVLLDALVKANWVEDKEKYANVHFVFESDALLSHFVWTDFKTLTVK
jgi:hypothetical protein